jgi:hypothetical protein
MVKRTAASSKALQLVLGGRELQVVALTELPTFFARHQPHPALQDRLIPEESPSAD